MTIPKKDNNWDSVFQGFGLGNRGDAREDKSTFRMMCPICSGLSKRLKTLTLEQNELSAMHLRAVQADDLATARQLDGRLSEASNGVRLYAERLRDHQVAHLAHEGREGLPDGHDQASA
jgi:hypothetical protein